MWKTTYVFKHYVNKWNFVICIVISRNQIKLIKLFNLDDFLDFARKKSEATAMSNAIAESKMVLNSVKLRSKAINNQLDFVRNLFHYSLKTNLLICQMP